MGISGLKVELGFGYGPLDNPSYIDVTDKTMSVSTNRGRNSPFDKFDTGSCTIVLNNQDGYFNPANSTSPYWGYMTPGTPVRVSLLDSTPTYVEIFTGFANNLGGWQPQYPMNGVPTTTVQASDFFQVIGNKQLPPISASNVTYNSQTIAADKLIKNGYGLNKTSDDLSLVPLYPGDRTWLLAVVLVFVGLIPAPVVGFSQSDYGGTMTQGYVGGSSALDYLHLLAESEGGAVYIKRDGVLQADSRYAPWTVSRMTSSQATFGYTGTDIRYADLGVDTGGQMYNHVEITPASLSSTELGTSIYENTSAISFYGTSTYTPNGLLMDSIEQATNLAEFIVQQYGLPLNAARSLTVFPLKSAANRDAVLRRELRDRVTVNWQVPGALEADVSNSYSDEVFVERIEHTLDTSSDVWSCRLSFSTAARTLFTDAADWLSMDGTRKVDGSYLFAY